MYAAQSEADVRYPMNSGFFLQCPLGLNTSDIYYWLPNVIVDVSTKYNSNNDSGGPMNVQGVCFSQAMELFNPAIIDTLINWRSIDPGVSHFVLLVKIQDMDVYVKKWTTCNFYCDTNNLHQPTHSQVPLTNPSTNNCILG